MTVSDQEGDAPLPGALSDEELGMVLEHTPPFFKPQAEKLIVEIRRLRAQVEEAEVRLQGVEDLLEDVLVRSTRLGTERDWAIDEIKRLKKRIPDLRGGWRKQYQDQKTRADVAERCLLELREAVEASQEGIDGVDLVRAALIAKRDEALVKADFDTSLLLTHAIAHLSTLSKAKDAVRVMS